MKKIITLILVCVAVLCVMCLAACGKDNTGNMENDIKNDITSMMDDATTIMDDISEGLSSMDDILTENGNVTNETESKTDKETTEGLFEEGTTEEETEITE